MLLGIFAALAIAVAGCGAGTRETGSSGQDGASDGIVCYVGHGFWDGSLDPLKGGFPYGYGFIKWRTFNPWLSC